MNKTTSRWTLPLLSVVFSLILTFDGLSQNWWSASGVTLSNKGTNTAVAKPDIAGRCATLDQVSVTTTDIDDWLVFWKTGVETMVLGTNSAGIVGTTNLNVVTTNGFAPGDLVLFNGRTNDSWSVCYVAGLVSATNILLLTNTTAHTAYSQMVPRTGDRLYRLVQSGRMNLSGAIGTWGLIGATNGQNGWQRLTLSGGGSPLWASEPGKPMVVMLRDDSPGAAIVAGTTTNEIWSAAGSYR